ncbi:TPA: LOW QUALITY PROTEIN: hypothetical protein N0F65_006928 [Lagenidium giganteum]|uniref:BRCT domain-containing protein n=1 Tax=Lagenidium giganteum TaxID=4803 RepID=A0AAV2ZFN9_9STRA|nr:TPA: LOW QUALITY PROTEIN: hypothetical protein N0F65_006928 [Lagenidium giganteum]
MAKAVDTGDLTLNEMARRWKQQQAQEKKVVTAKVIATKTSVIDDDEDLPPTQEATTSHSDAAISPPSSGAPTKSPQSRLALRKRDKLPSRPLPTPSKAIAQQYEYLDSSCKCGEMICQCDLPPDASSTSKQSTAIRNLEFAFAMPESQESESQLLDSAPDVSIMASKALDAMPASTNDMTDRKQPTPSKLLVPPHSSHESSRRTIAATELLGFVKANDAPQVSPDEVEESNAKRETIAASERLGLRTPGKSHRVSGAATINASASTKASILNDLVVDGETKESEFGSPSKKKSTKSQSPVKTPRACGKRGPAAVTPETPSRNLAKEKHTRRDTSPQRQLQTQATSETPSNRKRKRPFQSPDAGAVVHHNDIGTPSRTRAAKANAEEEQKSTPSVRTRPKMISPVPAARSYASRSKSLFKYKFDFCLTGFVGDGESSLVHILEDLGGKVYGQDVLSRGNTRAVVIATPVSWRKRKFMMAVACGIPVVHPEWIHACSKAGAIVPFDGFYVPSGYSVTTRKFECLYPKQLDIFTGYRFGIPFDVRSSAMKASVKDMAGLISSILLACGASDVIEDLNASRTKQVDIVLSDDHTEVCEQYSRKHRVPLKSFGWVTECVIRQQLVDLATSTFQPTKQDSGRRASHKKGGFQESVPAAVAHHHRMLTKSLIVNRMATLKLYKGELVLADITNEEIDHFLLFHVCEILEIFLIYNDDGRGKRKHEDPPDVILRVGVLKRSPYSPSLSRAEVKVIDIAASQVKRRVVAVAKQDFDAMKYRDESIFYFEDEGEISND